MAVHRPLPLYVLSILVVSKSVFCAPYSDVYSLSFLFEVYRRKSDKRKKQKDLRDKSAVRVGSNVEKVLELIEELLSCKLLSQNHRDELEWIEQVAEAEWAVAFGFYYPRATVLVLLSGDIPLRGLGFQTP